MSIASFALIRRFSLNDDEILDRTHKVNIYVGNLAYEVNDDDLRNMFSPFGRVNSAKVIADMYSGKSRGFGFVEMEASADGQKAIAELNGADLKGRAIVVNEARPREDRGGQGGGGGGGGGGRGRRDGGQGGGRPSGGGRRY